jgi:hypothetical protein
VTQCAPDIAMPGSLSSTSTARIAEQSRQVMPKRMRHQDPRPKQDGIRRPPNGRGKDPGHQLPEKNDPSGATRGNKKCTTSTDGNKKVNQAILLPFLSVFFSTPFPPPCFGLDFGLHELSPWFRVAGLCVRDPSPLSCLSSSLSSIFKLRPYRAGQHPSPTPKARSLRGICESSKLRLSRFLD